MVGKNYRLQDIQLSKNVRESYRLAAFQPQPEEAARATASPHLAARSTRARPLGCAPYHSPELMILTSARIERKLNRQNLPTVLEDRLRPSRLRPSTGRPALAEPEPASVAAQTSTRARLGGEYRARTGDLLVANQALSQLS